METIDRYLQAVEFWLPKKQRSDIAAELAADIYAQVEEQEAALGRKLNDSELEAILRRRGSPIVVANRYLPQQSLIGPLLFPIYKFVLLRVVAFCYLPWVLGWIGMALFGHAKAGTAGTLWTSMFVTAAMVTFAFAILERVQAKTHLIEAWNPRELPPVRDPRLIKRSSSYPELVVNIAAGVWWLAEMRSPITLAYQDLHIGLAPVWGYFFWGYLAIILLNIALAAVSILHPLWTPRRAAFRLAIDCAGGLLLCWLLKANVVEAFSVSGMPPARSIEVANRINSYFSQGLPYVILFVVVIALCDGYRIFRLKTPKMRLTPAIT